MQRNPKRLTYADRAAIAAFHANGGQPTQCPPGKARAPRTTRDPKPRETYQHAALRLTGRL